MAERSEERRVGKECRSLCDWSSDVCSSDLVSTLSSISCTSDSGCVAVGTSTEGQAITVLTRDGGSTWTIGGPLAGASEATSVDCRTVFTCIAIVASGAASWSVRTGNGGLSWQRDGDLP